MLKTTLAALVTVLLLLILAPAAHSAGVPAFTSTSAYKKLNSYSSALSAKRKIPASDVAKKNFTSKLNSAYSGAYRLANTRFGQRKKVAWTNNRKLLARTLLDERILVDRSIAVMQQDYKRDRLSVKQSFKSDVRDIAAEYQPIIKQIAGQRSRAASRIARANKKKKGQDLRRGTAYLQKVRASYQKRIDNMRKRQRVLVAEAFANFQVEIGVLNAAEASDLADIESSYKSFVKDTDSDLRSDFSSRLSQFGDIRAGERQIIAQLRGKGQSAINAMPGR